MSGEQTQQKPQRASREDLQELHMLMCDLFLKWLRQPDVYKVKPFHLAVVRQFLRDNGITKNLAQALDVKRSLEDLKDIEIPFLPDYSAQ